MNIENCATDATFPDAVDFPTDGFVATSGFKVSADFIPDEGSSLIDAGAAMTVPVAVDLAGKKRVYQGVVDIGCHEWHPPGFAVIFR